MDWECRWSHGQIRQIRPRAVIANYCWVAKAILDQAKPAGPKLLFLVHDLFSRRAEALEFAPAMPFWVRTDPDTERRMPAAPEVLIAITEEDASYLRLWLPKKKMLVAPMSARASIASSSSGSGHCLFVGSRSGGNTDGLLWFLESVWPLILKKLPDAHLDVYGSVCKLFTNSYPQEILHGVVPTLAPAYARSDLAIIPLRAGSGLKLKLIEAPAHGRAVVSIPVGLHGVELLAG